MNRLVRLAVLLGVPVLFLGLATVIPALTNSDTLKVLGGLIALPWIIVFSFMKDLAPLSAMEGLTTGERDKLIAHVRKIRWRIWRIGGVSLVCAFLLIVLSAQTAADTTAVIGLCAGIIIGIACYHLAILPSWHSEIQDFVDEVNRRVAEKKSRANVLTQMGVIPPRNNHAT